MGEMSVNPGLALTATLPSGAPRSDGAEALPHAAREFEAAFLDQALGTRLQGMGEATCGPGDDFRDVLAKTIAKPISWTGGIGFADAALREILKVREVA